LDRGAVRRNVDIALALRRDVLERGEDAVFARNDRREDIRIDDDLGAVHSRRHALDEQLRAAEIACSGDHQLALLLAGRRRHGLTLLVGVQRLT
jgi:hypothetical protein